MTVNIHVMMNILFVCHYRIWLQLFFHANKGKDFMLGFIAHNPYSLNIYNTNILLPVLSSISNTGII